MAAFDGGRQNPFHSNPVAPHDDRNLPALRVEHGGSHALRVPGPQLEDVPDLQGLVNFQRGTASGARLSGLNLSQVEILGLVIPSGCHAGEVKIIPVGSTGQIPSSLKGMVGQNTQARHLHGTQRTGAGARHRRDFLRPSRMGLAPQHRMQLGLIELVVASYQNQQGFVAQPIDQ